MLTFIEYKSAKGMNGKSVIDLFNRYRVIDYIDDYYEALHTTGFNEKYKGTDSIY